MCSSDLPFSDHSQDDEGEKRSHGSLFDHSQDDDEERDLMVRCLIGLEMMKRRRDLRPDSSKDTERWMG